jgi:hypothetical protein
LCAKIPSKSNSFEEKITATAKSNLQFAAKNSPSSSPYAPLRLKILQWFDIFKFRKVSAFALSAA